jgi:hypothetical protein
MKIIADFPKITKKGVMLRSHHGKMLIRTTASQQKLAKLIPLTSPSLSGGAR